VQVDGVTKSKTSLGRFVVRDVVVRLNDWENIEKISISNLSLGMSDPTHNWCHGKLVDGFLVVDSTKFSCIAYR
jgi:hypothetical protein